MGLEHLCSVTEWNFLGLGFWADFARNSNPRVLVPLEMVRMMILFQIISVKNVSAGQDSDLDLNSAVGAYLAGFNFRPRDGKDHLVEFY